MISHNIPSTAQVPTATLVAAADALVRAGRLRQTQDLLDATTADDYQGRALLALASAKTAIESDYRTGSSQAPNRVAAAEAAVAATGTRADRWDVALLKVRQSYLAALFHADGTPWFGPAGRDPHDIADLEASAKRLYDESPDDGRRGWASMFQGWIADNIAGERTVAPPHYAEALDCAESTGDDYLVFEALRHLGDHDHDDGDHDRACERWERSTASAARAGLVSGTLAQQLLLAVLHRDAGDEVGAQALGREIVRWAGAIDATRLQAQAQAFVDGVDPTAPPPDVDS